MSLGGSFVVASLFAIVFLAVGRLRFLGEERGGLWLSGFSGIALSYVFVDLLPHLAKKQQILLAASDRGLYGFLEHHAYLISLAGFIGYLALLLAVRQRHGIEDIRGAGHLGRLALAGLVVGGSAYLALIAYMAGELPEHRREPIAIFAAVMTIHLVGLAHYVREQDPQRYDRLFRFLYAGAAMLGGALAGATALSATTYALWFSLLAGSMIAVVTTGELRPITSFGGIACLLLGAIAFTGLLLALERVVVLD